MDATNLLAPAQEKLKELLTKTYGPRFTITEIDSFFTKELFRIDEVVRIEVKYTYPYGYAIARHPNGIEIVISAENYQCKARPRHIKKFTDEKIIKSLNEVLEVALQHKENTEARLKQMQRLDEEKKRNAALMEEETKVYENSFPNLKLYNSSISRASDGTYSFKGEFNKIPLTKMVEILKIVEESQNKV